MADGDFKRGIKAGLPIGLGYIAVSFGFGLLAVSNGLTVFQAVLISVTCLTSAGQLAGVQTMLVPGQYLGMLVSQMTINVRYAFMSVALSQKTDDRFVGFKRWLAGFFMTDEIFAVASGEKELSFGFFCGLAVLPVLGWITGTLSGSVLGSLMPKIVVDSFSIALYAMFVAIVTPAAGKDRGVLFAVLCSASLMSALFFLLPGIAVGLLVSVSAVAAAVLLALIRPAEV